MTANKLQMVVMATACIALAACVNKEGWPNLSDRLPDTKERNRVIERANPSLEPRPQDMEPQTLQSANKLIADVKQASEALKLEFEDALNVARINAPNAGTDATKQEFAHLWFEAQLALTRLSQTANRLDPLLFNAAIKDSLIQSTAKQEKLAIDTYVVAMRQELGSLKP